jgi:ribonuclease J
VRFGIITYKGGVPMSKIKFCALGGLGENGKNMYVVEVDEKIFVLDAGLKFPSVELYGIDTVIPNINYLIENKEKVQGIFLSHGHDDAIGAIPELLKVLNVGVFGTHFTMSLAELAISDAGLNIADYRLYRINDDKVLKFGNVTICFYKTTHSIPESVGVAIKTSDGAIVYAPDFTFTSSSDKRYATSYNKISAIADNGVLALCAESLGTGNIDRVNNDYALNHAVKEILLNSKRIIFALFSTDLDRIQKVINLCVANNRNIAIIGRKVQKTMNVAMNNDYLKIPEDNLVNLKYIDDKNDNNDDKLVVIVTGNRHEPYYTLQRMAVGQDRLIQIESTDNVVIICPPVTGTEKMATKSLDTLHRIGAKVTNISKGILRSSHADSEDLKMLYQMLNPKYIIPVNGEYRHQYLHKNIALEFGYSESNIIMLENGEQITFEEGILKPTRSKVTVGDVLVDGSIVGDINEVVLKDREMLSQDGTVLVVVNVNARSKKILDGPKVVMKGFVCCDSSQEVTDSIIEVTEKIITTHLNRKYVDWSLLKSDLKDRIGKSIYSQVKKNPIVIPIVIDIEE